MRCPKCCYLPTHRTLGSTLYLYMNCWLEFENCHSVAQMVIALHRQRRVTVLIPARVPIVYFIASGFDLV